MSGYGTSCSIWDVFLAFLAGVILLLLVKFGIIYAVLSILQLSGIATILNFIVGLLGILAVILFVICIFRRVWRCCFGRGGGSC